MFKGQVSLRSYLLFTVQRTQFLSQFKRCTFSIVLVAVNKLRRRRKFFYEFEARMHKERFREQKQSWRNNPPRF